MKYFKILLLLISFSSVSSASYYAGTLNQYCIEDYYIFNNLAYYQKSDTLAWFATNDAKWIQSVIPNFTYDPLTLSCRPSLLTYGMESTQFNFLLGLIGVIIGGVFMFFTINAFVNVGGKR